MFDFLCLASLAQSSLFKLGGWVSFISCLMCRILLKLLHLHQIVAVDTNLGLDIALSCSECFSPVLIPLEILRGKVNLKHVVDELVILGRLPMAGDWLCKIHHCRMGLSSILIAVSSFTMKCNDMYSKSC